MESESGGERVRGGSESCGEGRRVLEEARGEGPAGLIMSWLTCSRWVVVRMERNEAREGEGEAKAGCLRERRWEEGAERSDRGGPCSVDGVVAELTAAGAWWLGWEVRKTVRGGEHVREGGRHAARHGVGGRDQGGRDVGGVGEMNHSTRF